MKTIFDHAACPANDASMYYSHDIASPRTGFLNNR